MRERIAIDMDETICDTLSRHLDWYNTAFNQTLSKADLAGSKIYDKVLPEAVSRVRAYPDNPDFFVDIPIYPQARAVIEELHLQFDIVIATAAMEHPNSFAPKYQWLVKNLPFISPMNFVFCGNKGLVKADYLIDDSPRHFEGFGGQGVLFSAPHNLHEPALVRVNDWQDVSDYFLKI